jgi:hypothetical protein
MNAMQAANYSKIRNPIYHFYPEMVYRFVVVFDPIPVHIVQDRRLDKTPG